MPFLVLDSGGVSALAESTNKTASHLVRLTKAGMFPAFVPSVVLAECLTGDPRRDVLAHRLLKTCRVYDQVPESLAERAAQLRTRAGRGSAVDAIVVAFAEIYAAVVLTSDPKDLRALAAHASDVSVEPTWHG
jgi:predicted nucleic acid-binding protein